MPIQAKPDAAGGESIRILHLTDPHLFADAEGTLRGVVTQDSLQSVLHHYSAGDWRADRAVITGDLIQDNSVAAYDRFRDLLLPLDMRMHCVPGNHDVREHMRRVCCSPPFSYCDSVEIDNWLLVGIDSCIAGDAGGEVSRAEMERLSNAVSSSAVEHVMVCLHHPPIDLGSAWLDSVGLRNGEEFLQLLRTLGKVRLAVFGHVHQPYDSEHEGVRIIATPSTCRQFLPGSDDFAVDNRPPAYRRITLQKDGSSQTELIWLDDD